MSGLAEEMGKQFEEQQALIRELEHLKLEMDGVDNAKEEIGRLLGLTEEFRWKRISAAIHEQKRLIRELVAALTEFLEFGEYAYSHGREALAKAKAAGFEPTPTMGKGFPGNEP